MTASIVQILVEDMKKLSLAKIPGENVEVLCGIITDMCRRIEGSMDPVRNLASLAMAPFLHCTNESFRHCAARLHERADDMVVGFTWHGGIGAVKKRFRTLKGQHMWDGFNNQKQPDEVAAMKAELKVLTQQMSRIECYNCHKEGHMSRDCPKPRASQH